MNSIEKREKAINDEDFPICFLKIAHVSGSFNFIYIKMHDWMCGITMSVDSVKNGELKSTNKMWN